MKKLLTSLFIVLILLSGCSNTAATQTQPISTTVNSSQVIVTITSEQSQALNNYITTRENAVRNKDEQSFLSLFNSSDEFYFNEQKSWFTDCKKQNIKNYNLIIASANKISQDSFSATLTETFTINNSKRTYTYNLVFQKFDDGYKEVGIDMELMQLNGYNIYYNKTAKDYADEIKTIYNTRTKTLYKLFGYTPSFIGQVRIYDDMATMRGTIKPSTPNWVAGWNEYKQSIKIAVYENASFSTVKDYIDETILHEQTHAMLSDLSNDNLNYFMQEGCAMLFSGQKYELTDSDIKTLKSLYNKKYDMLNLSELEDTHLENLDSPDSNYYYIISKAYCYMIYRDHGIESLKSLLKELKTHEYIELTANDKLDTLNQLTNEALKKVLNEDTTTLTTKFEKYLSELK